MPSDTAAEFGQRLSVAREAVQRREGARLSYDSLAAEMVGTFGARYVPTGQTISNWHNGKVPPEGIRLEWIEWLAERYGVSLSSLSPVFHERIGPARALLSRSRCSALPPVRGQLVLPFIIVPDPPLALVG